MDEGTTMQDLAAAGVNATPGTPSTVEAAPTEERQQTLTRAEVLSLIKEQTGGLQQQFAEVAKEQGQRGGQSFIDRRRLNERLAALEQVLEGLVADGQLDESQASTYRRQYRTEALFSELAEQDEQAEPTAPQKGMDPYVKSANEMVLRSGLTPQDPEWSMVVGHNSPFEWYEGFKKAVAAKEARLRPPVASAQPQTPAAPNQPAASKASGVTAMELGGGGAPPEPLASLRQQMQQASRRGDTREMNRISGEIDRHILGGR